MPSNPSKRTSRGSMTASSHARPRPVVGVVTRRYGGVHVGQDREVALEPVKFHFDPLCPWGYQTPRWAPRLEELGEITLEWGVFSLEVVNLEDGKDPRTLEARSGPA